MPYAVAMNSEEIPQRVIDRLMSRHVEDENGCWMWQGATSSGYGRVSWKAAEGPVWRQAHRVLYVAMTGRVIPDGHDLDHLCHDPAVCAPEVADDCPHRRCINPAHMNPSTRRENLLRGGTVVAERRAIESCPQGHEYTIDNTLVSRRGQRQCKACTYERNRAYYWKNKERRRQYNKAWREKRAAG